MIILGIDPGYERLGIAVIEKPQKNSSHSKKETLLYSDCFKTSAKLEFKERLLILGQEINRIIVLYKPEHLAIENLFFQNNQKTAMNVAEVRGAILYIALSNNLLVKEFTPLQIKSAVAGHGQADKKQVADMIHKLMTIEKEIKHDDEYDAIAVALTASAVIR